MRKLLLICLVAVVAGCRSAGTCPPGYRTASAPTPPSEGVVFVANGSGDFRTVSYNLGEVVAQTHTPLQLETLVWSHGYCRYLIDHTDHANHIAQGTRLASQVAAYRAAYPCRKVYLIGHSAGCAVVLAATERLPPNSVDRLILLAPSVCAMYDLRPALRGTRRGIEVFYSSRDSVILGLGMQMVGTADRTCTTAAGQAGFTPVITCPEDAELYGKLRQHPWDPGLAWSGHGGGHYGCNQAGFLRAYVLPLLVGD
jgi:pimeloyl-ACP methyl ester carboxylesterase